MEHDTRISILFIYSAKGFGGIPRNLSIITKNIDRTKFRCVVALISDPGDEQADFRSIDGTPEEYEHVAFHRIDSGKKFDASVARSLRDLIKEHNVAILSCHGYKANFYGWLIRTFGNSKLKLFTIAHGWVTPGAKIGLYHILDKLLLRFFDRIVLVSEGQRRAIRLFFIPKRKLRVIHNAIDVEKYRGVIAERNIREEVGIAPTDTVVGFVGRLSREKDIETTLRAFSLAEHGEMRLLIAGDGPERERLESLAEKLGVGERVVFLGYQRDVVSVYHAVDIYVSSSRTEGLPNNVLEAMAMKLPCVLTDIAGHREIVTDADNGYLVPTQAPAILARRLELLAQDEEMRTHLQVRSRETVEEKFNLSKRIARLEEQYSELGQNCVN